MKLIERYIKARDTLDVLTSVDAYNHDDCTWDIDGYLECGIDDDDVLRERVEALENLAKAIERVNDTEIVYA